MSIKIKSYPNPVLGNGDDYKIAIDENALYFSDIEKDKDYFYCSIKLNLEDEVILNLIKEEKAAFFCDIDCVKTNYRTSFYEYKDELTFKIPKVNVVDNVDVNLYIVAMQTIENYTHPEFNEMYEDASLPLEEGDYIATLGSYYFNATVKYSKCPPPSSLMQVQCASSNSNITKVTFNTDEERIFIVMPQDSFLIYTSVCGSNNNADDLFVSSIAVDALAYALLTLRDASTGLAENLRNLLDKNNIEIDENKPEEYLRAARNLLEVDGVDPYTTFMKSLQALTAKRQENGSSE